jgi:CHASE3 domain sensor protein
MKEDILDIVNTFYDSYREDYLEMYGEETNNYLEIVSDLELHIEQENPHHIFVSLFNLAKKYTDIVAKDYAQYE